MLLWIQQLLNAIAYIESLKYTYNNINPWNILLNNEDQLKLVDFNYAHKISDDLKVEYKLYIRFYKYRMMNNNIYKIAGLITKQFALRFIFWYML
jgi:serine/threonine protein kinase